MATYIATFPNCLPQIIYSFSSLSEVLFLLTFMQKLNRIALFAGISIKTQVILNIHCSYV